MAQLAIHVFHRTFEKTTGCGRDIRPWWRVRRLDDTGVTCAGCLRYMVRAARTDAILAGLPGSKGVPS